MKLSARRKENLKKDRGSVPGWVFCRVRVARGALGNVRTETLRAFTRQETDAAFSKVA